MLLILGDVSTKGFQLTSENWSSLVQQFERMLGPYLHLPFHVTLGDRDIGECSKLKASLVHRVASSFPQLNHGGCGSFEMSNVSFISLNAMALLCGNNELLSDVETVIERESAYLQTRTEDGREQRVKVTAASEVSYQYRWRDNPTSSQSGPVLLLHFPLQQISKRYCSQESSSSTIWNYFPDSLKLLRRWVSVGNAHTSRFHSLCSNFLTAKTYRLSITKSAITDLLAIVICPCSLAFLSFLITCHSRCLE